MNISVCSLSDQVFALNVSEDLELENLKAFCEVESGVPAHQIQLSFNGLPLTDLKKTLRDYGIKDGDMLIMQTVNDAQPPAARTTGWSSAFISPFLALPKIDPCGAKNPL